MEQINLTETQVQEQIKNLASKLFLTLSDDKIQKLSHYFFMLKEKNEIINLISRKTTDIEILERHFYSSLIFVKEIQQLLNPIGKKIADMGTGGGFPGMVCGICLPEAEHTLIDSVGKKIYFLEDVVERLGLNNVKPVNTRIELTRKGEPLCPPSLRNKYDIVTARAMATTEESVKYCMPLLKNNGIFITIKTLNQLQEISDLIPTLEKDKIHTKILEIDDQLVVVYSKK